MPHTPGPWQIIVNKHGQYDIVATSKTDGIAFIDKRNDPDEERANAYLIAAAPEMLEALEELRRWFDDNVSTYEPHCSPEYAAMWRRVRNAIAKAKGEHEK